MLQELRTFLQDEGSNPRAQDGLPEPGMAQFTSLVLFGSVSLFILCDAPEKGVTSIISFLNAHCQDTASPTIE